MPYIPQRTRSIILDATGKVDPTAIETVGELNFAITHLVNTFCKGDSYTAFNEVMGVLESAKLEFYRRRVAPYEDNKIAENGDVYGPSSSEPLASLAWNSPTLTWQQLALPISEDTQSTA